MYAFVVRAIDAYGNKVQWIDAPYRRFHVVLPAAGVEGENLSQPSSGTTVVSDAMYSGGQALKHTDSDAVSTTSVTLSANSDVVVWTRAGQDDGSPNVRIRVDGVNVGDPQAVTNNGNPVAYRFDLNLAPGTYTIGVKGQMIGQGRNLFIDKLEFPIN
jgi:hypothetical protein